MPIYLYIFMNGTAKWQIQSLAFDVAGEIIQTEIGTQA